jgi:hypothetical protein
MEEFRTTFKRPDHAFKFANRFEFPYLFHINLPLFGPKGIDDIVYGLCGGMCFAALDYFNKGKQVPEFDEVDNINLRLFRYLWTRQLETLGFSVIQKLITWSVLDDKTVTQKTARNEVPKIERRIKKGEPAVLVLIRVRGLFAPTQNHQVLVTGYDYDSDTRDMTVHLYDPNHPQRDPNLTMNLARPSKGIDLKQSTGEPLRGFFVIDYKTQAPP